MNPRRSLVSTLLAAACASLGCSTPPAPASQTQGGAISASAPRVQKAVDLAALDGQSAIVVGVYEATAVPTKGPRRDEASRPKEYARVMLGDGTAVYLEPYATPAALRPAEEMARFDGKRVEVSGKVRRRMPSQGQSLVAPCVEGVTGIAALP